MTLDVRFVAASKRDLERAAADGTCRSDLLYRLNVVTIRMTDLAARAADVPNLFLQLINEAAVRYKRPVPDVPGALLTAVAARDWPGNVRELKNAAERLVLGLDLDLGTPSELQTEEEGLALHMARHEKSLIAAAIAANGGSLKATYEALGISRKSLYEKMQKYGLSRQVAPEDDALPDG